MENRFDRTEMLIGKESLSSLSKAKVLIFGIGGVGGYVTEALARSGIGSMVLDVTTHGKSGHAARTEGVNAIYEAIKDITWFQSYHFDKSSPLLGEVKMTVTIINAGTQHNVIPDKCTFTVDVRSNENYSNEEIYDIVCSNVTSEVKARSFRLNSSRISECHPIVQKAKEYGKTVFGSPTLSDQALNLSTRQIQNHGETPSPELSK